MKKYWFFAHKESNRYYYESDQKFVISDKVNQKNGGNIDPYIFSSQFLLSFCKQNQFNKFSIGDIIFFIIPQPISKNYLINPSKKELDEGCLKRKDFKNNYIYCDLVFEVKDIKKYDDVKKCSFYNSNIEKLHYERGKKQHAKCKEITLISTQKTSFQPQKDSFIIDILNLAEESDEIEIKKEIKLINTVDELTKDYKGIRTLKSNALRIFEISHSLGEFLIGQFEKDDVSKETYTDNDLNCLSKGEKFTKKIQTYT